ncbi:MAG TPA: hypothetical protein GX710_06020 [Clostridiales bacterium]|nr:hypothetical protein [Clostridiales bacterium]
MKINELKKRFLELKKYKFPRLDHQVYVQYPFDSKYLDDGLYITQKEDYWEVFFSSDHGYIHIKGKFETEDDACEYYFCCCKHESDNNRWF